MEKETRFVYTISQNIYTTIDPVHSAGLAVLCVFVGAEVCTHLLLCVCNLPQTG